MAMLPSYSGILVEAISIASTYLEQRQSISLVSFLQCPHFRSSRRVPKDFAKFTGVSSGTGVSCEFCEILKISMNTSSGWFWHLHQSRFPILILYAINRHLRRQYVQFLSMVENDGAKDFIFTFIFFRIISFFVKI